MHSFEVMVGKVCKSFKRWISTLLNHAPSKCPPLMVNLVAPPLRTSRTAGANATLALTDIDHNLVQTSK